MNKFDKTLDKMELCKYATGSDYYIDIGDSEHYETIKAALTQAAEIERGDKVVVDRKPTPEMYEAGRNEILRMQDQHELSTYQEAGMIYKAMIEASEGK